MIPWEPHLTEPNIWRVLDPRGQCIALIRPSACGKRWQAVVKSRPELLYPGDANSSCLSREAGMGWIACELAENWPDVV